MFIISILTVVIFALLLASLFKLPNKPAHALFIYLTVYGEIGFIAQLGHFTKLLNNQTFFLVIQSLLLLAVAFAWFKGGKPSIIGPWQDLKDLFHKDSLLNLFKKWPDVTALFLAVMSGLGVSAVLNYSVPPNNNDSISTHMSRVGYWLQNGSFDPWITQKNKQLFYPVNAQVQSLWTMLFSGGDHYVAFVQWLALIASMTAVFGIARMLKASRPQAILAALVLATLPSIILQSTTTQNNLVTGALFAICFYFFFLGVRFKQKRLFAISGAALGINLATNLTVLFLLPGFGIAILMTWLLFKQVSFDRLLVMAGGTIAAFLLIGSVIFFINLREYQNPLGQGVSQETKGLENPGEYLLLNSLRLIYQAADPSGLPSRFEYLGIRVKAILSRPFFNALNIPIESSMGLAEDHIFNLEDRFYLQEDNAWFGPVGFLILFPAMLVGFVWGIKKKEPIAISIFLIGLGFLLSDALLRPGWDTYQGRYFIPVVTLATPFLALWLVPGWRRWLFGIMIVVLSMAVMYRTTISNPAKPLREMGNVYPPNPFLPVVWDLDRIGRISIQSSSMDPVCRMVEQEVPVNAVMGIATQLSYYREYCFFGEHFTRKLVPVWPAERVEDANWLLEEKQVEYLLVIKDDDYPARLPAGFDEIAQSSEWFLYEWVGE